MSENDLLHIISTIGYKKDYYRFDMLVPKAMLGKGKNFSLYNSECKSIKPTAWERDDCKFPIKNVVGVHLVSSENGMVRIGVLIDTIQVVPFIKNFLDAVKDFGSSYTVIEFIPGEQHGV